MLNERTFWCDDGKVMEMRSVGEVDLNVAMECKEQSNEEIYCKNSILLSSNEVVCNSTTTKNQDVKTGEPKETTLHCYFQYEC